VDGVDRDATHALLIPVGSRPVRHFLTRRRRCGRRVVEVAWWLARYLMITGIRAPRGVVLRTLADLLAGAGRRLRVAHGRTCCAPVLRLRASWVQALLHVTGAVRLHADPRADPAEQDAICVARAQADVVPDHGLWIDATVHGLRQPLARRVERRGRIERRLVGLGGERLFVLVTGLEGCDAGSRNLRFHSNRKLGAWLDSLELRDQLEARLARPLPRRKPKVVPKVIRAMRTRPWVIGRERAGTRNERRREELVEIKPPMTEPCGAVQHDPLREDRPIVRSRRVPDL